MSRASYSKHHKQHLSQLFKQFWIKINGFRISPDSLLWRLSIYHISCLSKSSSQTIMGFMHKSCGWLLNLQLPFNCICMYNAAIFSEFWKYTTSLGLAYSVPSSSAHPSSPTVFPVLIIWQEKSTTSSWFLPAAPICHNIHHISFKLR